MGQIHSIIVQLLECLPDSVHDDDGLWEWCWDELGEDAQAAVAAARKSANELLLALERDEGERQHNSGQ